MTDAIILLGLALYFFHIIAVTQGLDDIAATARYVRRCERWLAAQGVTHDR